MINDMLTTIIQNNNNIKSKIIKNCQQHTKNQMYS